MSKEKNKHSLKKTVKLIIRGYKELGKLPNPFILPTILSSVANAFTPFLNLFLSARIINEIAGNKDAKKLITLVMITVLANIFVLILRAALTRWGNYTRSNKWFAPKKLCTDKFLTMDFTDIENQKTQQTYKHIKESANMGMGLNALIWNLYGLIEAITKIILSFAMVVSMFVYKAETMTFLNSPITILIVVLSVASTIFVSARINLRISQKSMIMMNKLVELNNIFMFFGFILPFENFRAKDIRIYNQDIFISKKLSSITNNVLPKFAELYNYEGKLHSLDKAISYLSYGLIYLFVILKSYAGAFGVGMIAQYVGSITLLTSGITSFMDIYGRFMTNCEVLEDIFAIIDMENKMYQGTLTVEKRFLCDHGDNDYKIEFKNVSFKYPNTENMVLENVSFEFSVGEKLAIVGMNGSGKTTFIKLMCRLYDPTEGEILLNGINIRKYNYLQYMSVFSVVFQDFNLFAETLAKNISCSEEYDSEKILSCLDKAGFSERLAEMPKGIETYLYKDFDAEGVEVSGGEAQKIALARALYKDSPFIILDEPTASLDPKAEYEIYSKFNDIATDKTTIYISHRLSSCRFCDKVAVFHEGKVVQVGSHDSLICDESSKYYELWNAQAQYYK